MGFGAPTDLPTIHGKIATLLTVTNALLDASQVKFTLASDRDLEKFRPKDVALFVRPGRFPTSEADQRGGGRLVGGGGSATGGVPTDGELDLILFARLWTGDFNDDLNALQDVSNGITAKWVAILGALEQFAPTNGGGDCILREPMRLRTWRLAPRATEEPGRTRLDATLSVKLVQRLS
jgi:hypothetical protein